MAKGRRYRSKPCVLCDELTRDWNYVCNECRKLHRIGREVEQARAGNTAPEFETIHVAYYWSFHPRLGTPDRDAPPHRIKAAALDLCHATEHDAFGYYGDHGIGSDRSSLSSSPEAYLALPGTGMAMAQLVTAIRDLMADYAEKAKRLFEAKRGRLVDGDRTIHQLCAQAVQDAERAKEEKRP